MLTLILFWFLFLYLLASWVTCIAMATTWGDYRYTQRNTIRKVKVNPFEKWSIIFLCSIGWPVVACAIILEFYTSDKFR